ncbi:MAG TPA: nucleotide exchange factor GrpE [Bacteroidetes bacterium]|nr:nucleotide exchange factor GrpE [Bacteroidota bacterium]
MTKKKTNIEQEDQMKKQTKGQKPAGEKKVSEEKTTGKITRGEKEVAEKPEAEKDKDKKKKPSVEENLADLQDKYLRLSAEFDNYRKRTLREKMELTKTAGEDILVQFLQVMDDFDRARELIRDARDVEAIKTGIELIYQKLKDFLRIRGVKEIEAIHQDFNTDYHEAVTKIPAPDEKLKGKVVDVVQKGYIMNDKVIRYSKVVVGE